MALLLHSQRGIVTVGECIPKIKDRDWQAVPVSIGYRSLVFSCDLWFRSLCTGSKLL